VPARVPSLRQSVSPVRESVSRLSTAAFPASPRSSFRVAERRVWVPPIVPSLVQSSLAELRSLAKKSAAGPVDRSGPDKPPPSSPSCTSEGKMSSRRDAVPVAAEEEAALSRKSRQTVPRRRMASPLAQKAAVSATLARRPRGLEYVLALPVSVSVTFSVYSTFDRAP
jgi:hypothetical protein